MRGYEIKLPVQLGRNPTEEDNLDIMEFYEKLLNAVPRKRFSDANWSLCESFSVGGDDHSNKNIVAFQWWKDKERRLIVVNYSLRPSKANIQIQGLENGNSKWEFTDLLTEKKYSYFGESLKKNGLYVELDPWKGQIFDIEKKY
jgi:hypothetical protein